MAYSDGRDGDLHVTSGQTVNLSLDHKYQYRTITVDAGGTISTTDTVGSVLYLAAQGAINIAGNIILSNKVNAGNNSWTTTIDGIVYNSPGCNLGGVGGSFVGQTAAPQGFGFGGGGAGGNYGGVSSNGGAGGGTAGGGGGGNATDTGDTSNNTTYGRGNDGGTSAGGGGTSFAAAQTTSGASRSHSVGYAGGAGGGGFGSNGGNGANPAGFWALTFEANDGSHIQFGYGSAGGGGAGGAAGRAGVHLALRGSEVNVLSTCNIDVSGTNGQNGGNGGVGFNDAGQNNAAGGLGGGGGGGGNGGTVTLWYGSAFRAEGPVNRNGGFGGNGGVQGGSGIGTGFGGSGGVGGSYFAGRSEAAYGSMIMMFN